MDFRTFAVLLLLVSASFAGCAGYTETFDVRVLDSSYRPIPGATVNVTYDQGTSFGQQYFTTAKETDSSGVAHFSLYNQGTATRNIDCSIRVQGAAGGSTGSTSITVGAHGNPVDIRLSDVYYVRFFIRDMPGYPLQNASLSMGGTTVKSGADGEAAFFIRGGKYDYLASYRDAKQQGSVTISKDTDYDVRFAFYNLKIDVVDDQGAQLAATLTIFNKTFELPDGHYESEKIFGEEIPYSVEHKGIVLTGTLVPSQSPYATVVFDVHSPVFGAIRTEELLGKPRLHITVSDGGEHASGLDLESMKATYKVEPSDESTPWGKATVFTAGRNVFTAEFPELAPNSVVRFRIEIKDKAGNRAEIDGKFTTYEAPPENVTQNATQNQTNTPQTTPQEQGMPLSYMVGGVIIAILAIYLVFRIKSKTS